MDIVAKIMEIPQWTMLGLMAIAAVLDCVISIHDSYCELVYYYGLDIEEIPVKITFHKRVYAWIAYDILAFLSLSALYLGFTS